MDKSQNRKIIILLFVGVLLGALDISIVGPAMPSIERTLEIGARNLGWIFSIYVLFNLIGISLFARLSDIHGRRKIYILALFIFGVGSLWVAMSHSFAMLIVGRAIQGFGASGIFPVASALVGDLYPPEKRGQMLGIIGSVFGLAFLLGPFVAGIMLRYFPWNDLFLINIPIILGVIIFSHRLLPSVPTPNVKRIDWAGIILLGVFLASLTYGLNSLEIGFWETYPTLFQNGWPFVVALIGGIALYRVEQKTADPILDTSFFQNQQIRIAGTVAIATGAMQACFVFIPKFVVDSFSVSSSTASFMLVPLVLATAIGSPVFGKMIDMYGVKRILILGLLLCVAGFVELAGSAESKVIYYVSGVFIGLGMSILSGSSLRYIILNNTSAEDRAISQGMLTIFISLGQLIATAFIGMVADSMNTHQGFSWVFLGTGGVLLLVTVAAFRLKAQAPA